MGKLGCLPRFHTIAYIRKKSSYSTVCSIIVAMIIQHPDSHKWLKKISNDPINDFGKNNRNRLKSTLKNIGDTSITYNIKKLDNDTIDWFEPLYNRTISKKNNAKFFNIRETTLDKKSRYPYYSLILYENQDPIGATIFSVRDSLVSIAYRIYPNAWSTNSLQANPALYSEYLINVHVASIGMDTLSHGRDRNPYGLNADIGLAIFKLSIGCAPELPSVTHEIKSIDLSTVSTDIFILHVPEESKRITKATLYASVDTQEKYQQLTKYPEIIDVNIIERH